MIGNNMKDWVKLIVIGLLSLFPFLCFGQGPEEALTKSMQCAIICTKDFVVVVTGSGGGSTPR